MKAKIGRMQYFFMIPNLVFGKAIGITSGVMVRKIGADTWTSMLVGFTIGFFIIIIMAYLGSKFPEKTIIQYSEELLGKWVGRAIGLLLTLFFAVAFATSANVMTLHLNEYFLIETPFFIVCLLYTLLCMYGVFLGVEVVVRFSLLGFFMSVMINITMIFGTLKDFKFINLLPMIDRGISTNVLSSVYIFSDIALAVLAVGMLYPMLDKKKKTLALSFWALAAGAILVIVWPLFEIGVMGTDVMEKYIIVCMQQVRCAQFTKYLPRYELLMVSFFAFGVYVQSVAMFYCAKYCFKQVTGIKKDWHIIIPLTVVLILLTFYMANDHNNFVDFLTYPWSQICAGLSIGLPLILFFTAMVRGKLKKQKADRSLSS